MVVMLAVHVICAILASYALRWKDGKSIADFRAVVLDGNYVWASNPIYNFQSFSTVFSYLDEATTPELLQQYDETLSQSGFRRRCVTGESAEAREGRRTTSRGNRLNVVNAAAAPIATELTDLASVSATAASPPPSPPLSPTKSPEREISKKEFSEASKRALAVAKKEAESSIFTGRHRQAKLFGYSLLLGFLAAGLGVIPRIPIYYSRAPEQNFTWFERRGGMEVLLWVALFVSCVTFTFLTGQRAYLTDVNSVAYKVSQGLLKMQYKASALTPSVVIKTLRNSMHGTKPKRSPLVFGLASTLGIFFIPAALVHLANIPSRYPSTANAHVFYMTESILTLMAPGLPHVIRAFPDFWTYWEPVEVAN